MEAKARKIWVVKAKRKESKRRTSGEERRKEADEEEKAEKGENDGDKESGRGVGDLEWEKRSRKIRERDNKVSSITIPQVNQSFWKKSK